jgi:AcrR family transcriptional regulator
MNGVHTEAKRLPEKIKNAREALLREGRRFLMENQDGRYGKFSVRELTSRCAMASGTFYHYFASKDELVLELMETDWAGVIDAIEPLAASDRPLRGKAELIYDMVTDFQRRYYLSAMSLMSPTPKNTGAAAEKRAGDVRLPSAAFCPRRRSGGSWCSPLTATARPTCSSSSFWPPGATRIWISTSSGSA